VATGIRELEVEAGTRVVTLDDYGTAIYFIEDGHADVRTDDDETAETLGPGDAFGEIGLLLTVTGRPPSSRARR
jgi:CRP-like cAMP-binding protein